MANLRFGAPYAMFAQVKLVNGTATVTNPAVTAKSLIFLSRTVGDSDKLGNLYVEYINPGTLFAIKSDKTNDNSTVNVMICEPTEQL